MKSPLPSPRGQTAVRALLALCVLATAQMLANSGCSSGAICYRNTDCPLGSDCKSGQCVRRPVGDGGVAGSSSVDEGTAGATDDTGSADASQTPDAN